MDKNNKPVLYTENELNSIIKFQKSNPDLFNSSFETDKISDGWHTFGDLYEFRKMYNAALFNSWAESYMKQASIEGNIDGYAKYHVHKSWKHHDGEDCFGKEGKWFIVAARTPFGIISNHYKAKDWDLFNIPSYPKSLFEFDGHTPQDVLTRLEKTIRRDNNQIK